MTDRKFGPGPLKNREPQERAPVSANEGERRPRAVEDERVRSRVARAKLIEQTSHSLTDLFTIISARIEILAEKVPGRWREELLAIRDVVKKGVELNERFFLVAQACQREKDK